MLKNIVKKKYKITQTDDIIKKKGTMIKRTYYIHVFWTSAFMYVMNKPLNLNNLRKFTLQQNLKAYVNNKLNEAEFNYTEKYSNFYSNNNINLLFCV